MNTPILPSDPVSPKGFHDGATFIPKGNVRGPIIMNTVLARTDLSHGAKLAWLYLASYKTAFPRYSEIGKAIGVCGRSAQLYCAELRDREEPLLRIHTNGHGGRSNRYELVFREWMRPDLRSESDAFADAKQMQTLADNCSQGTKQQQNNNKQADLPGNILPESPAESCRPARQNPADIPILVTQLNDQIENQHAAESSEKPNRNLTGNQKRTPEEFRRAAAEAAACRLEKDFPLTIAALRKEPSWTIPAHHPVVRKLAESGYPDHVMAKWLVGGGRETPKHWAEYARTPMPAATALLQFLDKFPVACNVRPPTDAERNMAIYLANDKFNRECRMKERSVA